ASGRQHWQVGTGHAVRRLSLLMDVTILGGAMRMTAWWQRLGLLTLATLVLAAASDRPSLTQAAKSGDKEALRTLLKQGAKVNAPDPDGTTALHWASYRDDLESVDLLLRAGAQVNAANDLGATPLWAASQNGSAAMVRRLLQAGANP